MLKRELNFFYKDYKHNKKKNLPYIIGKIACSSNYFILKNNTKITNKHSIKVSHLLRYRNQGILTSYKTVNSDNPKLTCRLNGLYKFSPQRIILDKDLKININTHIVNNSEKIKTIIFHNSNNFKKINKLKFKNIKLIKFQTEQNGYFDLKKIFEKIYKIGITNLLIECGKDLTSNILKNNLFNEFYIFKSSKKLNNRDKISILNIKNNLKNFKNINYKNTFLDKDTLIHYY